MKLLYATTNKGKLLSMQKIARELSIEIYGLDEVSVPLPSVVENGNNPLENAIKKAEAYFEVLKTPLFSCDSGLYFDGIDSSLQPGLNIRRVNGSVLSDEEMIQYYSKLSEDHGGRLVGRYKNAICLILSDGRKITSFDESLWTEPFILSAIPHPHRVPGFPLDSLSLDIKSGKYYYDLEEKSVDQDAVHNGFRKFLENLLAKDMLK
ncbi:MAG: hypothetical protein J6R23_00520 [Spirochaetales bacterium]|nr:hypothetical protein [Spirochaetales bacterium]